MKKQRGSASIEATISLTLFVFIILAIYMLINFCVAQAKISNAIKTTAKEMSQYSYFYHVLGLEHVDQKLATGKEQAVNTFANFNKLVDNSAAEIVDIADGPADYFNEVISGGKTEDLNLLYQQIQLVTQNIVDVVNDPLEFLRSMACMAGEKIWEKVKTNVIAAPLAKAMTRRHFGADSGTANEYLDSLGVVNGYDGLNFNLSTLFEDTSHRDIKITVYYQLDLASGLPFDLNVNMCQQAITRAWLGGDLE